MELQDLVPRNVKWEPVLDNDGEEKQLSFSFRKFTIRDEAWLAENYPGEKLTKVFSEWDINEICRIAYMQLAPASKRELMGIEFIDLDERGEEFEIAKTGPEKLQMLVAGLGEQKTLIEMLLETRGLSLPVVEKMYDKMSEEDKKKVESMLQ